MRVNGCEFKLDPVEMYTGSFGFITGTARPGNGECEVLTNPELVRGTPNVPGNQVIGETKFLYLNTPPLVDGKGTADIEYSPAGGFEEDKTTATLEITVKPVDVFFIQGRTKVGIGEQIQLVPVTKCGNRTVKVDKVKWKITDQGGSAATIDENSGMFDSGMIPGKTVNVQATITLKDNPRWVLEDMTADLRISIEDFCVSISPGGGTYPAPMTISAKVMSAGQDVTNQCTFSWNGGPHPGAGSAYTFTQGTPQGLIYTMTVTATYKGEAKTSDPETYKIISSLKWFVKRTEHTVGFHALGFIYGTMEFRPEGQGATGGSMSYLAVKANLTLKDLKDLGKQIANAELARDLFDLGVDVFFGLVTKEEAMREITEIYLAAFKGLDLNEEAEEREVSISANVPIPVVYTDFKGHWSMASFWIDSVYLKEDKYAIDERGDAESFEAYLGMQLGAGHLYLSPDPLKSFDDAITPWLLQWYNEMAKEKPEWPFGVLF